MKPVKIDLKNLHLKSKRPNVDLEPPQNVEESKEAKKDFTKAFVASGKQPCEINH